MHLLGKTPLVRLRKIEPEGVELWAKIEWNNLSGSVKARPAWEMVRVAEKEGRLRPGSHLLEPTSGNTGIALATIAASRGYNLSVVMPEGSTRERQDLLQALGASIIFSPAAEGSNGAIRMAEEILSEKTEYIHLDQYSNPANPLSHYKGTGPEIWSRLPEITHFVAGLGTGGTLMGTGRFLKEKNPDIQIVAAEPHPGETVQGLRSLDAGFVPPILDPQKLDRRILVRAPEAIRGARLLLREGLFAGISGGANLYVALRVAEPGDRVVVLLPDGGERYLSTGAWEQDPEGLDLAAWW